MHKELFLLYLLIGVWGCATTHSPPVLFIGSVQEIDQEHATRPNTQDQRTAASAVIAQGWSTRRLMDRSIEVSIANRGTLPLRFSYVLDTYVAKTSDGRTVELEKEFLTYPLAIDPGGNATVTLRLPGRLSADEILHLTATINGGKTVVVLTSVEPLAQGTASSLGAASRSIPRAPQTVVRDAQSAGMVLSGSDPQLAGTVPIVVEFDQEFGSSLAADVSWDDGGESARLASGEQRLFYLLPGRHELLVSIRVHGLPETTGRVPIVTVATQPIRVVLNARAHLTGSEVTVRVWQGTTLAVDEVL